MSTNTNTTKQDDEQATPVRPNARTITSLVSKATAGHETLMAGTLRGTSDSATGAHDWIVNVAAIADAYTGNETDVSVKGAVSKAITAALAVFKSDDNLTGDDARKADKQAHELLAATRAKGTATQKRFSRGQVFARFHTSETFDAFCECQASTSDDFPDAGTVSVNEYQAWLRASFDDDGTIDGKTGRVVHKGGTKSDPTVVDMPSGSDLVSMLTKANESLDMKSVKRAAKDFDHSDVSDSMLLKQARSLVAEYVRRQAKAEKRKAKAEAEKSDA